MHTTRPFVVVITGPTASGKTEFSYKLARDLPIEIVNADVGQLYTPLSVGTAKPAWKDYDIPHHLFDIIDTPRDLSVVAYRQLVIDTVKEIWQRGKVPVLVGGSLFYIKSLFYPPLDHLISHDVQEVYTNTEPQRLWQVLHDIDAQRARQIHPNDHYRIRRALSIWESTGIKPSNMQPIFAAPFHSLVVWLSPSSQELRQRIDERTEKMLDTSREPNWISEVKALQHTAWQSFLERKKLIGYPEILSWIEQGENPDTFDELVKTIQTQTWKYARRQTIFWKKFRTQLEREYSGLYTDIITGDSSSNVTYQEVLQNATEGFIAAESSGSAHA